MLKSLLIVLFLSNFHFLLYNRCNAGKISPSRSWQSTTLKPAASSYNTEGGESCSLTKFTSQLNWIVFDFEEEYEFIRLVFSTVSNSTSSISYQIALGHQPEALPIVSDSITLKTVKSGANQYESEFIFSMPNHGRYLQVISTDTAVSVCSLDVLGNFKRKITKELLSDQIYSITYEYAVVNDLGIRAITDGQVDANDLKCALTDSEWIVIQLKRIQLIHKIFYYSGHNNYNIAILLSNSTMVNSVPVYWFDKTILGPVYRVALNIPAKLINITVIHGDTGNRGIFLCELEIFGKSDWMNELSNYSSATTDDRVEFLHRESSHQQGGNSVGLIAGIVTPVIILLIIIVTVIVIKKRKKLIKLISNSSKKMRNSKKKKSTITSLN